MFYTIIQELPEKGAFLMGSEAVTETTGTESSELRAPYPPLPTFSAVFEKIKSRSGTFLDIETLQKWGVSKSNAQKILPALRFLGIIDGNGEALPLWTDLAVKDPDRYRNVVQNMVTRAYKKLVETYLDILTETDDAKLSDAIGDVYDTSASTRAAAVAFLKKMLSEAGLREHREVQRPRPGRTPLAPKKQAARLDSHVSAVGTAENILNVHVHVAADVSEDELFEFFRKVKRAKSRAASENE